jgi:hypothetical protein
MVYPMKAVLHSIIIGALILLVPQIALAWGPVVHLDGALTLLDGAIAISPALYLLIKKHAKDFLYGTLAADFVIGKKHAAYHDHCHNWDVARDLLREARRHGAHREAFIYGYLHHLGADVVAHNHIVPEMMVYHFDAMGVGHIYWEARADQRILAVKPEIREVWAALSRYRFPGHDNFLESRVVPTLLSNKISSRFYRSNLTLQQKGMWRNIFKKIDENSKLYFNIDTLLLWTNLAAQSGARAADNPWSRRLDRLDPVGREALTWAEKQRQKLRKMLREKGSGPELDKLFSDTVSHSKTIDINHFEEDWYSTIPESSTIY